MGNNIARFKLLNKIFKMFDEMLKELHQRFIDDMIAVRPQLANTPRELWAEGQPINGDKAHELGLVDEIG